MWLQTQSTLYVSVVTDTEDTVSVVTDTEDTVSVVTDTEDGQRTSTLNGSVVTDTECKCSCKHRM